MPGERDNSSSNRPAHRGLAVRPGHALLLGAALLAVFCVAGGYPAIIGATLLGIGAVLSLYSTKIGSLGPIIPLFLAPIGGVAAQVLFGRGHLVLRILVGAAAGVFVAVALSLIAITLSMRRDIRGAAA